jgi:cobalt-zinc-cadmium efflux system membrane fusion protein
VAVQRLAQAVILAAAATALACKGRVAPGAPEAAVDERAVQDAAVASNGDAETGAEAEAVDATATVTHVFSPVSGRVAAVRAQVGDAVKRGDVLATIESPDVSVPTTDVGKAEADFIAAEHQFRRMKELCKMDCTRRDYEEAEDDYRRAKAELERARVRARLTRERATYALPSPVDGVVTARAALPGAVVRGQYEADAGATELFTIAAVDGD